MMAAGVFDWAGVAALLGVLGAGLKYVLDQWSGRGDKREADITMRERSYRDKIEQRLALVEEKAERMERAYGLVVGIVHVWIDEIDPEHPSLAAFSVQLKMAFPVPADMPNELVNLVTRLDAKGKGGRK